MLQFHEKCHRLCSEEHDKEGLIAIDLKDWRSGGDVATNADPKASMPRSPQQAKAPLQRAGHSENISLEEALLKHDPVAGSCRIM